MVHGRQHRAFEEISPVPKVSRTWTQCSTAPNTGALSWIWVHPIEPLISATESQCLDLRVAPGDTVSVEAERTESVSNLRVVIFRESEGDKKRLLWTEKSDEERNRGS